MIQTRQHIRLIMAFRVVIVVLCAGFMAYSLAAVPTDGSHRCSDIAVNSTPDLQERQSLLNNQRGESVNYSRHGLPAKPTGSAVQSVERLTHQAMPCSSGCENALSCSSLCALGCATGVVSLAEVISDAFLSDAGALLPLWPNAHVVIGLVPPPLYRPPIV